MATFPIRALIQDSFLPEVRDELLARSIPVVVLETPQDDADWSSLLRHELRALGLGPTDVVVALPSWVDVALEELGIPVPEPPDYPDCLSHLLRRRVWKSTLSDVQASLASGRHHQVFIKPAVSAKAFSGTVVSGPVDEMLNMLLDTSIFPACGPCLEVHCSEVVEMNSEYAVYVVDGTVRALCHYMCKKSTCLCKDGDRAKAGGQIVDLDLAVVQETIGVLSERAEFKALSAYRADYALIKQTGADGEETFETGLVEVNDGYVCGRYEDMSPKDFTDMIVSRFAALQRTAVHQEHEGG